MVTILAKQSIKTKLRLKSLILLGNYEFYYAAGLISKAMKLEPDTQAGPPELYAWLQEQVAAAVLDGEDTKHLIRMVGLYHPEETYDDQMKELLLDGLTA